MGRQTIHRVEIASKTGYSRSHIASHGQRRATLASAGVSSVSASDIYFLEADLPPEQLHRLIQTLLVDDILQEARIGPAISLAPGEHSIEVTLLPGVTDSAAESLRSGARIIGIDGLGQIAVGQRYLLAGSLDAIAAKHIAESLIINKVVQTCSVDGPIEPPFVQDQADTFIITVATIPLRGATDDGLLAISKTRRLALDLPEMRAIQTYFRAEARDPTDAEIEMLAQTWSEHCVHKTFKARISYTEGGNAPRVIDGLLNSYIRAATEKLDRSWVRSAFVDNAGVVAFDDSWDIAFKVETHNHPSALEPFGGANTGVGGVVRDVIGVSARPIANTDVLCFGPQHLDPATLPHGVLHPRRIAEGVVHGIEDYGNKMGIPTVNGAFCYDEGYTANPLVFCGCLGIVPRGAHPRAANPGDLVVVVGGRTGRDGIGGATFSSMEMGVETAQIAGSSVQIGHPIHEKQAMEAVLRARDEKLYTAITDCGAGGLSSSVGEMAAELGALVHLDRVPLKYAGLQPWEVWLSEAQERMVLAVPPAHWPRLKTICDGLDVEATALGVFTGNKRILLMWSERIVGDLSTDFLNDGIPRMELAAEWSPPKSAAALGKPARSDLTADLLELLARPGTRSSEDVVRRYDTEVQGGTVVKPFVGPGGNGPSDAAVICPQDTWRAGSKQGVALSVGMNVALGKIDPYAMAWAAIDEAIRNCVAVGADPERIAILDNFCWGNPRLPDRLGSLVRCCEGCHDAAIAYGTPFVSGKDSLNNEFLGADGKKYAIPGTLLISAMGIVPDVTKSVTSDFKRAGNGIYLLGETRAEHYGIHEGHGLVAHAELPGMIPDLLRGAPAVYRAYHEAVRSGLVQACHDCSEGGFALALAEMCIGGGLGARIDCEADPWLFALSETPGRLVVEVAPSDWTKFETIMLGSPWARWGEVLAEPKLSITDYNGCIVIDAALVDLEHAFRGHLVEAA